MSIVASTFDSCPIFITFLAVLITPVSRAITNAGVPIAAIPLTLQVLRVDCRDPCHGCLDKARLAHFVACEIIRTFGIPHKMPDRPGLSTGCAIWLLRPARNRHRAAK